MKIPRVVAVLILFLIVAFGVQSARVIRLRSELAEARDEAAAAKAAAANVAAASPAVAPAPPVTVLVDVDRAEPLVLDSDGERWTRQLRECQAREDARR